MQLVDRRKRRDYRSFPRLSPRFHADAGLGSAGGFGGKREDTYSFYSFTSFTDPGTIYRYDYASGKSEVYFRPELRFDPSLYITEQVFFPSKDGTKVPMFIVRKITVERNGKNPALLYAYGGFNVSLSPSFSTRPSMSTNAPM